MKQPLLGKTLSELQTIAGSLGMQKYTAKQIAEWIYQKRITDIDEMSNISKTNREMLASSYIIGRQEPVETVRSNDGTVKYLFPTSEGKFVETVYIPEAERATLCVSCQVGCKMDCVFCQTGKQGWNGDLTAGDIINQIVSIKNFPQLTNIVFMGQGEPLDNYDNVMKALEILTGNYGMQWSPKRITVSSVGLRKNLKRFLDECQCHLAISMHSPIHEVRLRLMPAEKQFPISEIVDLLKQYDWTHQRRVTFEYTMFGGMNDSQLYAKETARMLSGLECRVNLIRWHKIPDVELNEVEEGRMKSFRDYLNNHGITATIRASRGQDIFAACGLLSTARKDGKNTI